jgi:hypothetical protein
MDSQNQLNFIVAEIGAERIIYSEDFPYVVRDKPMAMAASMRPLPDLGRSDGVSLPVNALVVVYLLSVVVVSIGWGSGWRPRRRWSAP